MIYFKVSHPKPPGDKSQKSKEFKIRSKKIRREGGSLFENLNVYLSSRWYSKLKIKRDKNVYLSTSGHFELLGCTNVQRWLPFLKWNNGAFSQINCSILFKECKCKTVRNENEKFNIQKIGLSSFRLNLLGPK